MINKRNFWTAEQKLLAQCKGMMETEFAKEEIRMKALNHFVELKETIVELARDNQAKEMHGILKSLIKTSNKSAQIEGYTVRNGEKSCDPNEILNEVVDFYALKYGDEGSKHKFPDTLPPNIELSGEEMDTICKQINPNKSNGSDYVPLSILNQPGEKQLIRNVVNSILKLDNPDKRAFYTRLVCINKTKSPTLKSRTPAHLL